MNPLKNKLAALSRVYDVYTGSTNQQDFACAEKCSHCCTTDVTLTTLEAYRLVKNMAPVEKNELERRLADAESVPRFRPAVTTNRLAEICAAGEEPPDEKKAGDATRCPLLVEDLCKQYELRPFHCRCMVSRKVCSETGSAEMADHLLALNTVFLQVIEHLDRPGCTGNLLDLLLQMQSAEFIEAYENGRCNCAERHLVANRPMTVLMVPPEHQERLAPVLCALGSIRL